MSAVLRALAVAVVVVGLGAGLGWLAGGPTLVQLALLAFGLQWAAFVPSSLARTERFYDLTGALSYLTLLTVALLSAPQITARSALLAGLVAVWAVRLGTFLAWRVHRDGGDRRFDTLKHEAPRFFVAWTLQGLWVFLTPLPVWIALTDPAVALGSAGVLGLLLWGAGFAIEVVADAQKTRFRSDPDNADRFLRTGLWAWSRHPNYFGEIVLWVGVFVLVSPQLDGLQWLALASPALVITLLVGVSGIPLLEARAEDRWGDDPDYRAYVDRTPVLVPRPPR